MNQPRPPETGTAPARQPRFVMCAKLREVFSPAECARVIEVSESFGLEPGVVREADVETKFRDSQIARFGKTETTSWIYDRIFDVVGPLNRETWRFDLAGAEVLQYASYSVGGHYDWHLDLGVSHPFTMRKVTVAATTDLAKLSRAKKLRYSARSKGSWQAIRPSSPSFRINRRHFALS